MKTNYHTHTTWCDGKDAPENMIQSALEKNFTVLGFSAHSMGSFSSEWHIKPQCHKEYIENIRTLADTYKSSIEILAGFEADYFPLLSTPSNELYARIKPDFIIGSVHFLFDEKTMAAVSRKKTGIPYTCFTADGPEEEVREGIRNVFRGNAKKAVQTYFSLQRDMIRECSFDIIGHIDVIRKRNSALHFFSENEAWYKRELAETAKTASKHNKIVEINTGGIARGILQDSYPSYEFLQILKTYDVPVCINSDAHSAKDLDCAFVLSAEKAKDAGYTERMVLSRGSWKSIPF